jgi:hypothetical protein
MIISRDFPVERLVSRALPQILSLWFAIVMLRRGNGGRKGSGYSERLGGQPTLLEDVGGIALGAMKSPAQLSPGGLSAYNATALVRQTRPGRYRGLVLPRDKKIPAQSGADNENYKAILGSSAPPHSSRPGELFVQGYNSIRGA